MAAAISVMLSRQARRCKWNRLCGQSRGHDLLCRAESLVIKRKAERPGAVSPKYKVGRNMAGRRLTPEKIQAIRDFTAHWGKIVARRALEDAGPDAGLDFQAMEDLAAAAAAGLTEGTLAALLEQRAQALPAEVPCPDCGRLCPVTPEERPLTLHTGQTIPLHEPLAHCPACRRDFFPPANGTAAGQPRL